MTGHKLRRFPAGTFTVTDSRAALFLSDPARRNYLTPFMNAEVTLSDVASELHLPLNLAHYWTQKLVNLGLVTVTRTQPRTGRAVRYYRAVAPAFFLPFHVTPAETLEAHLQHENTSNQARLSKAQAHALGEQPGEHGFLFTRDPANVQAFRRHNIPEWNESNPVFNAWLERPLSKTDALALRRELQAVLDRYAHLPPPDENDTVEIYLHLGLAPL